MKHSEVYFSVDVETAGPIPGDYSMLSLGSCRVDAPEKTFYAELRPISRRFVQAALDVSGFDLDDLARNGRDPRETMESFSEWVSSMSANGTPVFLGFNASFDWSFVNWYFHTFVGRNPFGFGAVDIKAYFMGLTGCRWEETRSSRLPELLRSKRAAKEQHNALSDALHQAEIFRRMVEFRTQLLDA